jgi:hypothetical protein
MRPVVWFVSFSAVLALASSQALAQTGQPRLQLDGRPSVQGWKVPIAWEEYEAIRINIGESPSMEQPAFVFDRRGDGITIDFRNDEFMTPDGMGQGNIADPRPVKDLEKALDRARRNLHFQYRIWLEGHPKPVGVILTPYLIKATRSGNTVVVKLTREALIERDVQIHY